MVTVNHGASFLILRVYNVAYSQNLFIDDIFKFARCSKDERVAGLEICFLTFAHFGDLIKKLFCSHG